jgi:hypothetical protein
MSQGSHHEDDESPFFADITLDLAEAHDIAETPQPIRKLLKETVNSTLHIPAFDSTSDLPLVDVVGTPTATTSAAASSSSFISDGGIYPNRAADINSKSNDGNNSSNITIINNDTIGVPVASTAAVAPPTSSPAMKPMNQISSNTISERKVAHAYGNAPRLTPSSRRWPRDIPWAVAFCIVVPLFLIIPILHKPAATSNSEGHLWLATANPPRHATLHSLWWGYIAVVVLSRVLYRSMGGGDGDDARHFASTILLACAPISVSVYLALIVALYFLTPRAFGFAIIPIWYLSRDLYLFRTWKRTATTPGGRQAFFQALTCMTLDILSRSLRRSSFYRTTSALLLVQLGIILVWRMAILSALRAKGPILLLMALFGGKWATGTVARMLSLVASGGIASWFSEQSALVAEMQQMNSNGSGGGGMQTFSSSSSLGTSGDEEMVDFQGGLNTNDRDYIPEAYRTVDASAYKPVLVADDGMDDDYEDEDYTGGLPSGSRRSGNGAANPTDLRASTVKTLLFSGLSISFGSVAQCGLLGGLAQFVWSQLRKIDTAMANVRGFQGMSIGAESDNGESILVQILKKLNIIARNFVRSHSDMAMSHVAAYHKAYQRAAQDVAILVDESGKSILSTEVHQFGQ